MTDFSRVTDRVFTGARIDTEEDVEQLVAAGVTHVINCRGSFDDVHLVNSRSLGYLWIPTEDNNEHKDWTWFERALKFAMPVLSLPKPVIYAHCEQGVNRGPSIAYSILRAQGLTKEQAEGLIRTARPIVKLAYKDDADSALVQLGWAT